MDASSNSKPKRPAPLSIRLSDEERAILLHRAGSMPVSTYVKSVALGADVPSYRMRRRTPSNDDKLLAQILMRMGSTRVANNLNQIAKHLNQGTLILDEELEVDIGQAVADVAWIRMTLARALGVER